jgi:hypothetical protein
MLIRISKAPEQKCPEKTSLGNYKFFCLLQSSFCFAVRVVVEIY